MSLRYHMVDGNDNRKIGTSNTDNKTGVNNVTLNNTLAQDTKNNKLN